MNNNPNNFNKENQNRGGNSNPKSAQPNKEEHENKKDAMHVNDDEDMEVEGTERSDLGFQRSSRIPNRYDSNQPQP